MYATSELLMRIAKYGLFQREENNWMRTRDTKTFDLVYILSDAELFCYHTPKVLSALPLKTQCEMRGHFELYK